MTDLLCPRRRQVEMTTVDSMFLVMWDWQSTVVAAGCIIVALSTFLGKIHFEPWDRVETVRSSQWS